MRRILLVFWFLVPVVAYAVSGADTAMRLDSIPPWVTEIDKGWKFHTGDNKTWADSAYNDSKWQAINPSYPIYYLPQVRKAEVGWFRLKLLVGKALRGKTFALAVNQVGASEIYLDGKLLMQYGKVSNDHNREQTYDPYGEPLTIQFNNAAVHVLAVRYSYTKQNLYIGEGESVFYLGIAPTAIFWEYFNSRMDYLIHRAAALGVFIILFILHLAIYLSDRKRKINLYLFVFNLLMASCFINAFWGTLHKSDLIVHGIFYITAPFTFIFFLLIVYDLFGQPKKLLFRLLVVMCLLIIPFEFWRQLGSTEVVLGSCGVLVYLENTRISIIAFRKKKQNSTLFLCGQVIALIFFCAFNYIGLFNVNVPYLAYLIIVDIAFLTPAVVISILLALEFSQNNISLKLQLDEVQRLSERSRQQELEKQNLLASQNELLEKQVEERTLELSQSLKNLKQTQTQLIQSEKMASLGELTAGIAHEIQNPLNFVNNFSEVSVELLNEMDEELDKGDIKEAKTIGADLKQNLEKIKHHGKRADFIVKGMLEHSRTNTGEKQLTDMNVLCDEFLKLSYHGLRAKDKSFNADMVTLFDPKLPKVNVSQQDMGRVMLNLFNNAFYAVNQKLKNAGAGYKPEVTITTFAPPSGGWGVKVKDNGVGIPDAIKDKIMQPFFTTKPTGEGTGLGLSLTYDIVVKGHGGSIGVDTKEGEFTEFTVLLPA